MMKIVMEYRIEIQEIKGKENIRWIVEEVVPVW